MILRLIWHGSSHPQGMQLGSGTLHRHRHRGIGIPIGGNDPWPGPAHRQLPLAEIHYPDRRWSSSARRMARLSVVMP